MNEDTKLDLALGVGTTYLKKQLVHSLSLAG